MQNEACQKYAVWIGSDDYTENILYYCFGNSKANLFLTCINRSNALPLIVCKNVGTSIFVWSHILRILLSGSKNVCICDIIKYERIIIHEKEAYYQRVINIFPHISNAVCYVTYKNIFLKYDLKREQETEAMKLIDIELLEQYPRLWMTIFLANGMKTNEVMDEIPT